MDDVDDRAVYLSVSERVALGRAARRAVPRSCHAAYEPARDRIEPVARLQGQDDARVPDLVPIRYGRMLASPFTFFRGAALVMAADLAATPRSGFRAQCCGDAHLSNFGLYASPERRLVFDINDFDETLPGPWEWDIKRLCASLLVAARHNGFRVQDQERTVLETAAEYRSRMREFASMPNLDVWYTTFELDRLHPELGARVNRRMRIRLDRLLDKAVQRDNIQAFAKLTEEVDGEPRFVSAPPLIVPLEEYGEPEARVRLKADLDRLVAEYRSSMQHDRQSLLDQFRLVEIARKVVGVGSVGTGAWIALLLGRDGHDPLILQMKEAQRSVLEEFAGRSRYAGSGERVVAGQRIMQASSDIFLGWLSVEESVHGSSRDYYVRQLRDWKGSINVEAMNPRALGVYGGLCASTLAHAHARSGDRVAIAAYLGGGDVFDRAILGFSEAYAEQNERDYAALAAAVAMGRVEVELGV